MAELILIYEKIAPTSYTVIKLVNVRFWLRPQLVDATLYLNWQDGVFGYDSQHEH